MKGGVPGVTRIKNLPASAGDAILMPGSGRSPGKEMAIHSRILIWEMPWTEEPGRLESMGSQKNQAQLSNQRTTTTRR